MGNTQLLIFTYIQENLSLYTKKMYNSDCKEYVQYSICSQWEYENNGNVFTHLYMYLQQAALGSTRDQFKYHITFPVWHYHL